MRRGLRTALLALAPIVLILSSFSAAAIEPCPNEACTDIAGVVLDPHGNPVPFYPVIATREGDPGYREKTSTDAGGRYAFHLPPATLNGCYHVMGQANDYYAQSSPTKRLCSDTTANLYPKYRINLVGGVHSKFIPDDSRDVALPVTIRALSRTNPAPFAGDPLPWELEFQGPQDPAHTEIGGGVFSEPQVGRVAEGVWEYRWAGSVTLPAGRPGHYDMDWGAKAEEGSLFNPMMECLMVWYGFGLTAVQPAKALPGTMVTLSGTLVGDSPGKIQLQGPGRVWWVSGSSILSWSDRRIEFLLPVDAKSGWVTAWTAGGAHTNRQPVSVGI